MKCPYCALSTPRCAQTPTGRAVTECSSCCRIILEHQTYPHHLFHTRAQDTPLQLVLSDLPTPPQNDTASDPFTPTGFITAFSAFSLEPVPLFLRSTVSFSGHLAELERVVEGSGNVVVDGLRAYMQIVDVASILGLDCDISDHAFQLFRDCCNATCLRNRSVEALATAALVQAIREAQEPRTLQEISIAANVPQKEIGKYIKILGEALQLSQPINSNSISVHMPRFCTLLQLNKSAQELATHIGEVVINKCFCTRRNPISISAAAIYLACQLEDKRKTQAEICKVTGLTEVTLRKVYKELLENWDDLLPPNYTPAVPPEKAFPTTAITSGRSLTPRGETPEMASFDKDRQPELKPNQLNDVPDASRQPKCKENTEHKSNSHGAPTHVLTRPATPWQSQAPPGTSGAKDQVVTRAETGMLTNNQELEEKITKEINSAADTVKSNPLSSPSATASSATWPFWPPSSSAPSGIQFSQGTKIAPGYTVLRGSGSHDTSKNTNQSGDT